ncbi:MAG: glycosyltransferase [Desulfovibrio sp.]|nr:glycosyltransferase [Desulfovibrio sp.]
MHIVLYLLISLILILLFLLYLTGLRLERQKKEELAARDRQTVLNWPRIALIVPVAGSDPRIEPALTSLLSQNYPHAIHVVVTEKADEPAVAIIARLKEKFDNLVHVVAGKSSLSGQKNHNLLQGIAAVSSMRPDCYVFCDSTHIAPDDFLLSLVHPIACGEASFTTGYHEIVPKDTSFITLAYTASVLMMRLLQALSVFTQPWGGAMAIRRGFFEEVGIADLWRKTVVDDCSLVPLLQEKHRKVRLVARALLVTECRQYKKDVWEAWMDRQILFPKFCAPAQWFLLGVMLLLFLMPPFLCLEDLCLAVKHASFLNAIVPLSWFGLFFLLISSLRRFLPFHVSPIRWIGAFLLALVTFLRVYSGTFGTQELVWHGYVYTVAKGGIVREKKPI